MLFESLSGAGSSTLSTLVAPGLAAGVTNWLADGLCRDLSLLLASLLFPTCGRKRSGIASSMGGMGGIGSALYFSVDVEGLEGLEKSLTVVMDS